MSKELQFTDEDLKRLKEANHFEEHNILALIHRLEAAEKVCKFMHKCEKLDNANPDWWYLEPKIAAWRKAAGKP